MNRCPPWLLAVALGLVSTTAEADAYSWNGSSGRLEVDVFTQSSESTVSENDFALWAKRFNSVIPRDATVSIKRNIEADDWTWMTIRQAGRVDTFGRPGEPDFEWALPIVEKRFGRRADMSAKRPKLYTIQLFASRSAASAMRFAAKADERGVAAEDSFFQSACHPCFIRETSVLGPTADAYHRVVVGSFDDRSIARRSLAKLKRTYRIPGFVRAL